MSMRNCECLGDQLFGQDVDALFAYETPKVVSIQDRTLGITRIAFTFVIFLYVVVYEILYRGAHFKVEEVSGTVRLQWQQPTAKCNPFHRDCKSNFTSTTKLPYCTEYAGPLEVSRQNQLHCAYKDAWDLPVQLPQGVLLPTRIESYKQVGSCDPDGTECVRTYAFADKDGNLQEGGGEATPTSQIFVANVEDFTLLIDHSFRTRDGFMEKDDYEMPGFWQECSDVSHKHCKSSPIPCVHKGCQKLGWAAGGVLLQADGDAVQPVLPEETMPFMVLRRRKHSQRAAAIAGGTSAAVLAANEELVAAAQESILRASAAAHRNVISIKDGDVLSIATMLKMAGGRSLEDVITDQNETRRMRGGALAIRIHYDNADPWRLFRPPNPPKYTISVMLKAAPEFKQVTVLDKGPGGRLIEKAYGLLVVVEQDGKIRYFDPMYALMVLTTALGLMAVAGTITELLAMHVLEKKRVYKDLKYQFSEDLRTVGTKKTGGLEGAPDGS